MVAARRSYEIFSTWTLKLIYSDFPNWSDAAGLNTDTVG